MNEKQVKFILGNNNWLVWLPIRNFLPASLLRELVKNILIDSGELIENHFSDVIMGNNVIEQSWLLNPIEKSGKNNYLWQSLIRYIVSGTDNISFQIIGSEGDLKLRLVEFAISLGDAPLAELVIEPEYLSVCNQPKFLDFLKARTLLRERLLNESTGEHQEDIIAFFDEDSPLNAIILKHFGDLLLIEGKSEAANALYSQSLSMLQSIIEKVNFEPLHAWRDAIYQSKANASLESPNHSIEISEFVRNVRSADVKKDSFVLTNGSLDAFIFSKNINSSYFDSRTEIHLPSLLKTSHNASIALTFRLNKDYDKASRAFHSLQRRQLALGLGYESQRTFGLWAQTIIEALSNNSKNLNFSAFSIAIDFFLSCGNVEFVKNIPWPELLVDNYVNESIARKLGDLFTNAKVASSRLFVGIELIEKLLSVIRSDAPSCKQLLLIIVNAESFNEGEEEYEVFREYVAKALERLTKMRHDLPYCEIGFGRVLGSAISSGGLYRVISNLSIAEEIIHKFPYEDRLFIVENIMTILGRPNSANMGWPVLRPSLNLLSSDSVIEAFDLSGLGRGRIVDAVVQIGVESKSEYASLLYRIANLQTDLLPNHLDKMKDLIETVREDAKNPNRSNAPFNIHALLATPDIVGKDGFDDALNGFQLILASVRKRHNSVTFPIGYEVLTNLRSSYKNIALVLDMPNSIIEDRLQLIFNQVLEIWTFAIEFPQIFCEFSFLSSSEPNDVIVHNWALETLSFGAIFGAPENVQLHLEEVATKQPKLRPGIHLAFATLSTTLPSFNSPVGVVESESRDEFYSKLGRRLVAIQKEENGVLWRAVFERCLTLGPRADDAAVFVCHKADWEIKNSSSIESYSQRVASNGSLRILLMPLIEDLSRKLLKISQSSAPVKMNLGNAAVDNK